MTEVIQVSTEASYSELRDAENRIKEQLAKIAGEARAEGIAQVVALIKEFEITPEELNLALAGKAKRGRKPKGVAGASKPKSTGVKAKPKYRNPADHSQVWSGRGIAPAWIKDVAKEDRDAYLIPEEATSEATAVEAPVTAPEAVEDAPVAVTAPLFGNAAE